MLSNLKEIGHDPIMKLMVEFRQDQRPEKIELGIGVYKDETGNTPIMSAVSRAQVALLDSQHSKDYLGLAGNQSFNKATKHLILGGSGAIERASALQTPGGSGALRLFVELAKQLCPETRIWLPKETFPNHPLTATAVGIEVIYYPYLDPLTQTVDESAMLAALSEANCNDLVLIHGCCHNPTGADITLEQWRALAELAHKQGFMPLIDLAYQGFGKGITEDITGLRLLVNHVENAFISVSYSKNMGLYRERTGCAIAVGSSTASSQLIKKHLLQIAACSYAMPPDHGAAIVAEILGDKQLFSIWQQELGEMRDRLKLLRLKLVLSLNDLGNTQFDYIEQQSGLFSLTALDIQQIERLKSEFGVYIVPSGRINIAGVGLSQCGYLASAINHVVNTN
ncbi:aromatic amino acid transaminase [Pseudoalteromonas sp. S558]|uniref:amino acid aminotransferase n=1 Tax=Pseudoalteromonas sp. S558 TaxID=2066515 RepID=UPI00110C0CD0|nr:aromatic amino acid transaminase [Pseudoalteromonas sp. S558]TMN94653.1 aromatic amino acid aminotransferase [Pseudoalteromonas sp. S558]